MREVAEQVAFTRMEDGSAEDYALLGRLWSRHRDRHLVDNVLAMLEPLRGPKLGYQVDRYEHSLQSATRALRDGADEEMVVAALLHDIGDSVAPDNHSQLAAAVLRPFVSERAWWVVQHHGIFQGYYYWHHVGGDRDARERHRGHPHFEACAAFCADWDQVSFDPDYDTAPLAVFEPMVRRLFAQPREAYG